MSDMTSTPGKTSDIEILAAIKAHRAPAVGTADIAEQAGVSRQAADKRLRQLDEDGLVEQYRVGQAAVWFLTAAGQRYLEDMR